MKIKYLLVSIVLLMASTYAKEFAISTGASHQKHPEIVFDGAMYRVVYDSVGDIWCAKVTPEGAVASKVRLTSGADPDSTPSIAFDGTNFFIVWTRYSSTFGAIMNQNGQIISGPFMVQMNGYFHPVITYANNRFLIAASYLILTNGTQGRIIAAILTGIFTEIS